MFCLRLVHHLQTPIADYTMPVRGLTQWFSEEQAYTKREQLRLLVMELKEQLNPDLVYDPASDGCVIALSDQPESFDDSLPGLTPKPLPGGAPASCSP